MARVLSFNLFLVHNNLNPQNALSPGIHVSKRGIIDAAGFDATAYFRLGEPRPPEWSELLEDYLKTPIALPESRSVSAILFIRTAAGFYAYTFGIGGRALLRRDAYAFDFGKKVVLSAVEPTQLRSIDIRAMRDQPFLTRQQATRATSLREFGIDTLQDHLRAVTGPPMAQHAALATILTGADSLSFRSALDFTDLGARADAFKAIYDSNAYQNIQDFKWVDQLTEVRNTATIAALDALLLTRVQQQTFEFGPPTIIDWSHGPTFSFAPETPADQRSASISKPDLVQQIAPGQLNALTIAQLKDLTVYLFQANAQDWEDRWSAYNCLEVDLVQGGVHYVLGGGRWSSVQANFLARVNDYISEIQQNAPNLPAAGQQDRNAGGNLEEGLYIHRVTAANPNYARIHQNGYQIFVGGREVELCDIYDIARDFIHLKIWRSSQGFSALAMQAANAAELLLISQQFVQDGRASIESMGNNFHNCLPDGFNPRQYRIVLGLIREEAGDIPFFSRLTLMRAGQRIERHGLRAAFRVVPVQ
jgi:uncharacterized protein (TIGR04141 family)